MRPQEKTPEIIAAAEQYSNGGWREHGEAVPTVEGLAVHLGKSRATMYQWAAVDAEFARYSGAGENTAGSDLD